MPATEEITSIQGMINIKKNSELVITSESKKKKISPTVHSPYSEVSNTFYFVDHWSVAFEDQHLYKSLENVQQMSVPKQPFRSRTPYLWLEFQLHLGKGCPLASGGGRAHPKESLFRAVLSGARGWLPLARRGSVARALVPCP